jgi:hypothetical protein
MSQPQDIAPSSQKRKDGWDKADILGKLLGAIAIPVGLAVVGYWANAALQDRTAKDNAALQDRAAKG